MSELARAMSAESLKVKRTLALRLAVIAPLFIVMLQLGVYLARGEDVERAASNPVVGFSRQIVTLWTLLFLPLWATLAASLCASLDHNGNHWDQLSLLAREQVSFRSHPNTNWMRKRSGRHSPQSFATPIVRNIAHCSMRREGATSSLKGLQEPVNHRRLRI